MLNMNISSPFLTLKTEPELSTPGLSDIYLVEVEQRPNFKSFSFQLKLKSQFDVINPIKSNSWRPQRKSTIYLVNSTI